MKNFKKGYLLIDRGIIFSKRNCPTNPQERERMSRIPYALAVDFIMYAMICIRPDMAYSLRVVSRYQSDLGKNHWKIIKIILKYLKNTKDQWLVYGKIDLKLMGFIDFNFQPDHDDSKSMSGYIYTLNSGAIC